MVAGIESKEVEGWNRTGVTIVLLKRSICLFWLILWWPSRSGSERANILSWPRSPLSTDNRIYKFSCKGIVWAFEPYFGKFTKFRSSGSAFFKSLECCLLRPSSWAIYVTTLFPRKLCEEKCFKSCCETLQLVNFSWWVSYSDKILWCCLFTLILSLSYCFIDTEFVTIKYLFAHLSNAVPILF